MSSVYFPWLPREWFSVRSMHGHLGIAITRWGPVAQPARVVGYSFINSYVCITFTAYQLARSPHRTSGGPLITRIIASWSCGLCQPVQTRLLLCIFFLSQENSLSFWGRICVFCLLCKLESCAVAALLTSDHQNLICARVQVQIYAKFEGIPMTQGQNCISVQVIVLAKCDNIHSKYLIQYKEIY